MLSPSKYERKGLTRMFRQVQHNTVFPSPQRLSAEDPAHANALTPMNNMKMYEFLLSCIFQILHKGA
jgi:hypothetical protein